MIAVPDNWRLVLYQDRIKLIGSDQRVRDRVDYYARSVVADARRRAPKRTGQGAASIHRELQLVDNTWTAVISWDQGHDYMMKQELGTRVMRPHSFLRPAFEARGGSIHGRT